MQGRCEHPKKVNLTKIKKKRREKIHKIKKIEQNYHNAIYKWVKSEEYLRGNPPHPIFFLSPHLPKINPAYASGLQFSICLE